MHIHISKKLVSGIKAWLDTPMDASQISEMDEITFSGWIVANNSINVFLQDEDNNRYYINVLREDVAKKIKRIKDPSDSESVLGFCFKKNIHPNSCLKINIDGVVYDWISFHIRRGTIVSPNVIEFCDYFDLNKKNNPSLKIDKYTSNDIIESLTLGDVEYCLRTEQLSHKTADDWRKLANYLHDGTLIKDIGESGKLKLPCMNSNVIITRSFIGGDVNFVECNDGDIIFYLIQVTNSGDAIYLPHVNTCIVITNVTTPIISGLIGCLRISPPDKNSVNKCADIESFLVGHSRPYHFLYDSLLGLELFSTITEKTDVSVIGVVGWDFISPIDLFECVSSYQVLTKEQLGNYSKGCIFRLGLNYSVAIEIENIFNNLDERIRKLYSQNIDSSLAKAFPIIWVGITGQKRSWIEQVDGYANIIKKLHSHFPSLAVIFDGWTAPLSPSSGDCKSIEEDQQVVDEIKKLIPNDILTIDVVGSTVSRKISYAQMADFFIANYMTGSVSIARFARKPGIGHMSNISDYMAQMHCHYSTVRVDTNHITDIIDDESIRADFVSYSIDWIHIYNSLVEIMDSVSVAKIRRLTDK
ncbi:hypothetical protein FHC48_22480 [Enterobacter sp. EC_50]|uniref:hypothetical protein n=1 Tax=Enterobacter sp. EC_50 TaxID=2584088 RepID=UPI001C70719A|nr:hypothetical protein [Enterobacter sp. EC_50]MBW9446428.1 hypothetical protein [Enterobacter sp. EC_50]